MSPANIEHSIRQKLLNLSRLRHVDYNLILLPLALSEECYKDNVIMQRWQAFLTKTTLSHVEDSLEKVALSLQEFFAPVIQSFSDESGFKKHWDKQKWI